MKRFLSTLLSSHRVILELERSDHLVHESASCLWCVSWIFIDVDMQGPQMLMLFFFFFGTNWEFNCRENPKYNQPGWNNIAWVEIKIMIPIVTFLGPFIWMHLPSIIIHKPIISLSWVKGLTYAKHIINKLTL
jgi:hypothetical protein